MLHNHWGQQKRNSSGPNSTASLSHWQVIALLCVMGRTWFSRAFQGFDYEWIDFFLNQVIAITDSMR